MRKFKFLKNIQNNNNDNKCINLKYFLSPYKIIKDEN